MTFAIHTSGGPWATGVPSLEVAKALAMDLFLYDEDDEDRMYRTEVRIEHETDRLVGHGVYFIVIVRGRYVERMEATIAEEHRCPACEQLVP